MFSVCSKGPFQMSGLEDVSAQILPAVLSRLERLSPEVSSAHPLRKAYFDQYGERPSHSL